MLKAHANASTLCRQLNHINNPIINTSLLSGLRSKCWGVRNKTTLTNCHTHNLIYSKYNNNGSNITIKNVQGIKYFSDFTKLLRNDTTTFQNKLKLNSHTTFNNNNNIPFAKISKNFFHSSRNNQNNKSEETSKSKKDTKSSSESGSKDIWRLLLLIKNDWRLLSAALGLLTVSCSIGMAIPKIIGIVLDALRTTAPEEQITVMSLPLPQFFGGIAVALVIGCAANYGRVILLRILSERLVARLRSNIIKRVLHQDAEFYDTYKVGDLISRLGSDAYVVSRSITQKISDGIKALFVGSVGIGMMVSLSPQLSGFLMLLAPPILFAAKFFGRKIRLNSTQLQEATANMTRVSEEQFNGIKTIQSFVAEKNEINKYNGAIRQIFRVGKDAAFINGKFFTTASLIGDLSFLIVLSYGSYLVLGNQLSIGDLTAYMLYTEYTGNAVFGLSTFYSELMQGAGAATRLFELTDKEVKIPSTLGKNKFIPTKPNGGCEIEFKDVSFAYPTRPANQIFKNLNFKIEAGSNVCIVGPSGRGKSTIALLLLHYYNPTNGEIVIDGQTLNEMNTKSLRRKIGIVQQEPTLMSGTIRDNITYGLTYKPTKEEIRSAAKQCFCHNFITKFPDTYDTVIGPHGASLSGGQRQRIAIARALIKKPNILILDEATSALDVESEGAINYTFGQIMKSKSMTIVSIAHRLSTIRRSENIIVLGNDGSVVEMGKFKELFEDPNSELSKLMNEKTNRNEKKPDLVKSNITSDGTDKDSSQMSEVEQEISAKTNQIDAIDENAIEEVVKDVTEESKPIKIIR
ncbi:similar to Saccharomyces cerevisiae YPL270W MDL2 Mitochondrial inner membrane half-type ATP- binding cassette (ABC) transporter, required for respiratory growth at high temperature [Maudiozyma barnettii]|uniref:Similar to Saccharomyces cerevisiae YPL270W MDL2 Mitochondrial inner membrane half-type ATP- binding cassette (ABC) transporter, required for respiratory growth at high temperature n=1 Tax=Maudiozyma barnettii TaxID=61262 RepID=A0A8H2VER4_9SACH|nr:ATP-binding cassette permease MDL2 [Kazachstania barnettii]CAB4254176.1 similar to Saccharomyces cerevisiae YPL270W MDL2 Mitochondrial inner membrane half-type ATP- binding cassette (ABC) transporter, required for respiratory growth at high temperature [Kazachstania barnettii]CAD1785579.1 similar to Saccharomyces cerevisiae YPL270W MDL2 Mitochondrial inner membrane half-type ATP- binding cassette (ABC) transporter, required for respiratory growth at high temperature [Kazachstania barnettii]